MGRALTSPLLLFIRSDFHLLLVQHQICSHLLNRFVRDGQTELLKGGIVITVSGTSKPAKDLADFLGDREIEPELSPCAKTSLPVDD